MRDRRQPENCTADARLDGTARPRVTTLEVIKWDWRFLLRCGSRESALKRRSLCALRTCRECGVLRAEADGYQCGVPNSPFAHDGGVHWCGAVQTPIRSVMTGHSWL